MLVYFVVATPVMMDDGFHYEGFAESLAGREAGFQIILWISRPFFFAVPVFWLTRSHDSIIIHLSAIFSLLSIPLAYFIGKKNFIRVPRAGIYFLILFLLMPYPYTTMMRGISGSSAFVLCSFDCLRQLKQKSMDSCCVGGWRNYKAICFVFVSVVYKKYPFCG